jgi:hypothetical protein
MSTKSGSSSVSLMWMWGFNSEEWASIGVSIRPNLTATLTPTVTVAGTASNTPQKNAVFPPIPPEGLKDLADGLAGRRTL